MTEITIDKTQTVRIEKGEECLLKGVTVLENKSNFPIYWQDIAFEDNEEGFTVLPYGTRVFSTAQDIYIKKNDIFNQVLEVTNKEF